jgi:hypothetical protein
MFQCSGRSNSEIAQAACESVYGTGQCTTGTCGSFSYWYYTGHTSCDSAKAAGYEWIYANSGHSVVGEDYGCGSDDVSGNQLFVRYRSNSCWSVSLANLECPGVLLCQRFRPERKGGTHVLAHHRNQAIIVVHTHVSTLHHLGSFLLYSGTIPHHCTLACPLRHFRPEYCSKFTSEFQTNLCNRCNRFVWFVRFV